ncbi:Glutamate synthase [NADPH] large chain [Posidoniimonas polymericola]|uniref:Glutamate synthase [NADPH] large chain n=1 Tax=Posidoniimonas polymericola TaxID=2528002 RepID=A0A5C5ZGX2_9BACT|nr:FMN-binding glutamate synthase family protein [Posidoniimonas polymericola]TWT85803.1 Glutamate synthase [NADPH] large chain [Posidoniimonas polymericola]
MPSLTTVLVFLALALATWVAYDVLQKKHAILHNFPIVGHFRYWLEAIGPELRQYIVTNNDEERPFTRDQRRWVYASSKQENNYFGFGTDNDLEASPNYLIIRHSAFPLNEPQPGEPGHDPLHPIACEKVLGEHRRRAKAFRPASVVNLSAMSFGSLSAAAVEALNRGALLAGCLHNTGEGAVSPHHQHGGDLVWQIGTACFGCRDERGRFDFKRFSDVVAANPVRAIEIKLSQGAKPGHGGVLPAAKITSEISAIRGVPMGRDCISPASHAEFHDVDSLLDFVEQLAEASGLPVGVKSAVGQMDFWEELTRRMAADDRGVDFVTIDGGEGGTGAAPLAFSDHVALPFKIGFGSVYRLFRESGLQDKVVFIGSGKLGFPESALLAMGMGCDMINVAREAMLSIGCIQAQRCHTGHCPTGVATQNRWLMRGLDPTHKANRFANYVVTLRKDLLELSRACGVEHPSQVTLDHFDIVDECFNARPARVVFGGPDA